MISMFRTRFVLLGMVSTLSGLAALAPAASAKINFEWLVGGKLLATGVSKEFTVTNDGKLSVLKITVLGPTELTSSTLKVEKGANIKGGKPGTNEEVVVFTGVKVAKPLNEGEETCAVNSPGAAVGEDKYQSIENGNSGKRGKRRAAHTNYA